MIRTFLNEMGSTFSWAMECMRLFLREMDGAEIADYFISGRGRGKVISTFGKRNWAGRNFEGCWKTP